MMRTYANIDLQRINRIGGYSSLLIGLQQRSVDKAELLIGPMNFYIIYSAIKK